MPAHTSDSLAGNVFASAAASGGVVTLRKYDGGAPAARIGVDDLSDDGVDDWLMLPDRCQYLYCCTCFTGTKAQILTPVKQKYKY